MHRFANSMTSYELSDNLLFKKMDDFALSNDNKIQLLPALEKMRAQ